MSDDVGTGRSSTMTPSLTLLVVTGTALMVVSCHALKCYKCHSGDYTSKHWNKCTDDKLNTTTMPQCTAQKYCYKLVWPCPEKPGDCYSDPGIL